MPPFATNSLIKIYKCVNRKNPFSMQSQSDELRYPILFFYPALVVNRLQLSVSNCAKKIIAKSHKKLQKIMVNLLSAFSQYNHR